MQKITDIQNSIILSPDIWRSHHL